MCRGRTVQIKCLKCDRLNREYDKSAFLKSNGKLFKLFWQQLQKSCPRNSWMFGEQSVSSVSGTQLSCSSVGDQLTIIGKASWGMTGQGPIDERCYLELNTLPDWQPVKIMKHW